MPASAVLSLTSCTETVCDDYRGTPASVPRPQTSNVTSPQPAGRFPRMVPGRRTVHGGVVQDRRAPVPPASTTTTNGPSSVADAQAGGRTLLDKLTSKFAAKR